MEATEVWKVTERGFVKYRRATWLAKNSHAFVYGWKRINLNNTTSCVCISVSFVNALVCVLVMLSLFFCTTPWRRGGEWYLHASASSVEVKEPPVSIREKTWWVSEPVWMWWWSWKYLPMPDNEPWSFIPYLVTLLTRLSRVIWSLQISLAVT